MKYTEDDNDFYDLVIGFFNKQPDIVLVENENKIEQQKFGSQNFLNVKNVERKFCLHVYRA